ncbi:MAG: SMP-30/gluconolactonase/LRE family protein [Bacteroidales bacterium]
MDSYRQLLTAILFFLLIPAFTVSAQQMVAEDAEPVKISEGHEFTEGPVWHPSGYLLFSDIPENTVFKWVPDEGSTEYIKPSGHSNGLTYDQEGRLVLAQHVGAVSKANEDGSFEVLVNSYNGKRLNSPNDLVVSSGGAIYFTDPPYGVNKEDKELDFQGVYRYTEDEGLKLLSSDFDRPNGIALSPDEKKLYVNDSRHNHIRVFQVKEDGFLDKGRVFAEMESDEPGAADGMKVDAKGNVYSTGPGGLWIFSPEGKLIQQVNTPRLTNLAWGGKKDKTLFMTSPKAVYKLNMKSKGHFSY